jgi:UDP-N-acetylmuramate--alanine ligase
MGKVEPVFVEEVSSMAQAIIDFVQNGDVVITMGAGSISTVPTQVVELSQTV